MQSCSLWFLHLEAFLGVRRSKLVVQGACYLRPKQMPNYWEHRTYTSANVNIWSGYIFDWSATAESAIYMGALERRCGCSLTMSCDMLRQYKFYWGHYRKLRQLNIQIPIIHTAIKVACKKIGFKFAHWLYTIQSCTRLWSSFLVLYWNLNIV